MKDPAMTTVDIMALQFAVAITSANEHRVGPHIARDAYYLADCFIREKLKREADDGK